jgi:hypothetical protein
VAKRTQNPRTAMMPIPLEPPFEGLTKIILISNKGEDRISTSFNSLPNEYMPEVERLIRKLNRKFAKKVVKYLKKRKGNDDDVGRIAYSCNSTSSCAAQSAPASATPGCVE